MPTYLTVMQSMNSTGYELVQKRQLLPPAFQCHCDFKSQSLPNLYEKFNGACYYCNIKKKKSVNMCNNTESKTCPKDLDNLQFYFFSIFHIRTRSSKQLAWNWRSMELLFCAVWQSPRKSHTNTHHYTYSLLSRSKSNQNKTESTLKTRRTQGRVGSTNKCFLLAPQLIRRGRKVILGSRTSRWARPKHPQSCCKISKLPLDKVCFERAQKAHKVCLRQIFTQRNSSDEVPLWCQWH